MRTTRSFPRCRRLLGGLLLGLALAGCAGTRNVAPTVLAPPPATDAAVAAVALAVVPFDTTQTLVGGGHHEGMAQIRQPWIWGLSDAQRGALYSDLVEIARYAFIDELKRLGLHVRVAEAGMPSPRADAKGRRKAKSGREFALTGKVRSIELNTFGRGLGGAFAGFGSAGDYWEARLAFADVQLADADSGEVLWRGELEQYAKLAGSPVKLDMDHFDLLSSSLRIGMAGSNPTKLLNAVEQSKASYRISETRDNPVELGARLAARDLAKVLAERLAKRRIP